MGERRGRPFGVTPLGGGEFFDFDLIERQGLGVLRLPPGVLWGMAPREFFNALRGHHEHEAELESGRLRAYGDTMRNLLAWHMANTLAPYSSRPLRPADFLRQFEDDDGNQRGSVTQEELRGWIIPALHPEQATA